MILRTDDSTTLSFESFVGKVLNQKQNKKNDFGDYFNVDFDVDDAFFDKYIRFLWQTPLEEKIFNITITYIDDNGIWISGYMPELTFSSNDIYLYSRFIPMRFINSIFINNSSLLEPY